MRHSAHRALTVVILSTLSLTACGPAPSANPSPSVSPSAQPTAQPSMQPSGQPSARPSVVSGFSLSGQLEDLLPTYAAAPQLEFVSQQTGKVYQAKVDIGKGYQGYFCSDGLSQLYPEMQLNLDNLSQQERENYLAREHYQMSYQVSGLPPGESFELRVSYPDQKSFAYDLSQETLSEHQQLNISLKQGIRFDQQPKASLSEVYFKVTTGQGLDLQASSVKARSLDPDYPYEAELKNLSSGVLFAVPANIALEIITQAPNRQPLTTVIKTPASAHDYRENDLEYAGFEVVRDSQKSYKHLLLTPQQPVQPLRLKKWTLSFENAIVGSNFRVRSLDPALNFNTLLSMPASQSISNTWGQPIRASVVQLEVPENTPLQIEADFGGQPNFNGVYKAELQVKSDYSLADQSLVLTAGNVYGGTLASVPGLSWHSCTLSAIEKTLISGKVTSKGQPLAYANVTLKALHPELDSHTYRVVTGSDAKFWFGSVSGGVEYELKVEKDGLSKSQIIVAKSNKEGNPEVNVYNLELN